MKEENKKKNEELQSRRQFFKKAGKAALPILGAIALGQIPLLSHASTPSTDCSGSCSYGCHTTCHGSCQGCSGCGGSCSYSCSNRCQGGCSSRNYM